MDCEIRDELALQFLLAADEDGDAQRELRRAMNATQMEGADTRIRRVRAHALYTQGEVTSHCAQHGCGLPDLPALGPLPPLETEKTPPPTEILAVLPPPEPVDSMPRQYSRVAPYAWGALAGSVLGLVIRILSS